MEQQAAELSASLSVDMKKSTSLNEPEPQLEALEDANMSKNEGKKKNRSESLEKDEMEEMTRELQTTEEDEKKESAVELQVEEGRATPVSTGASIEETLVNNQTEETTSEELGPPPMERRSSLDTLMVSRKRAVGSLLSRFKVGRKKSLSSRTDSLEESTSSSVEMAKEQQEAPEKTSLGSFSMGTVTDYFGKREQSIKEDKCDDLERKEEEKDLENEENHEKKEENYEKKEENHVSEEESHEKEEGHGKEKEGHGKEKEGHVKMEEEGHEIEEDHIEESHEKEEDREKEEDYEKKNEEIKNVVPAILSSHEIQTQVEVDTKESDLADGLVHDASTVIIQNTVFDSKAKVSSEGVTENTSKADAGSASLDANESTAATVEMLKSDTSAIMLETNVTTHEQATPSEGQDETVFAPAEIIADDPVETGQHSADVAITEPVSLKLDLDLATDQSADIAQEHVEAEVKAFENASLHPEEVAAEVIVTEAVVLSNHGQSMTEHTEEAVAVKTLVDELADTASVNGTAQDKVGIADETSAVNHGVIEFIENNENAQGKATSTSETELLTIKVTPPTSELPDAIAAPIEPEILSPVKSLASRFEGKREQSLDSLKFRTVREFFPEERSVRVGAEKKKYEAQAQQQKQKAEAEKEAKSKYKAGTGFKSSEKGVACGARSPELKASAPIAQEPLNSGDPRTHIVASSTTDTAASRKKFSYDGEHTAINSPSESSDDAPETLTPVKSIASRFEGKHEQSLDDLKFRTVREFFPEKRSVCVGSEKQKFEAQPQRDESLDNLKFRTVREFFPDDGMRSIHVGAEKAKFEALTKQQEEATTGLSSTLPTVTSKIVEEEPEPDASTKTSSSSLDRVHNEVTTSAVLCSSEAKDDVVVESADRSDEGVAGGTLIVEQKSTVAVDRSTEVSEVSPSAGTDTSSITVIKGNMLAASIEQDKAEEVMDVVASHPSLVGSETVELMEEAKDSEKFEQQADKAAEDVDTQVAELVLGDSDQLTHDGVTNENDASKHANINFEQNANGEEAQDVVPELDGGMGELSSGETDANKAAELDGDTRESEQTNPFRAASNRNSVQVAEETIAQSELIELGLKDPVESNEMLSSDSSSSVIASTGEKDMSVGLELLADNGEADSESQGQVPESTLSAESGFMEHDLEEPAVEALKDQTNEETEVRLRPMLTTEQSFVIEDDHTIGTEDMIVVGERSMTDGEDDFEALSPTKAPPVSVKAKPTKKSPKLTRKMSTGSVGSVKSSTAKPPARASMKRASVTAPTTSFMAKKSPMEGAEESRKVSPQRRKKSSASKFDSTSSDSGSFKSSSATPTIPIPMKRASITAPTASWQARNVVNHTGGMSRSHSASKTQVSKPKGPTGFAKPTPPPPTVPVVPKRASIMAPTASFKAKKAAGHVEDVDVAVPVVQSRNKKYMHVKSKVLDGLQSGVTQTGIHKPITKEEFIAAERRKSFGSSGVKSTMSAVDRRASLTARVAIEGPPDPFVRSALSRKKLSSTQPRYLNYENSPGYAERARQQYERRKRLEEENAAKSEKRQQELRTLFTEKQQKWLTSSAEEVRRGWEAHEFAKLVKESEMADKTTFQMERRRSRSTRSLHRTLSATSSVGASSSNDAPSRSSMKSSVSSAKVTMMESDAVVESIIVSEETVELTLENIDTEAQEDVLEVGQADKQTISVSSGD